MHSGLRSCDSAEHCSLTDRAVVLSALEPFSPACSDSDNVADAVSGVVPAGSRALRE